MSMTIRRAGQADLDAILPLVREYRVFYGQAPDAAGERAFAGKHLRDGSSAIFLAEDASRAIGFVQLFQTWSTVRLAPVLILEDLFVEAKSRKRGAARGLIDAALAYARESGAVAMFLETATENYRAQAIYERGGWEREALFLKFNAPI